MPYTMPDIEVWQAIPEYEDYEVSDLGRVRRRQAETWDAIPQTLSRYRGVWLHARDGRFRKFQVHVLVAEAFLESRTGPTVNHLDGNKHNNHADNLEWATHTRQMQHARAKGLWDPAAANRARRTHGGPARGEDHFHAKLKQADVEFIRAHPEIKGVEFARRFGVAPSAISRARHGVRWGWLGKSG